MDPPRDVSLLEPEVEWVPARVQTDRGSQDEHLEPVGGWNRTDVGKGAIVDHAREVEDGNLPVEEPFKHSGCEHRI